MNGDLFQMNTPSTKWLEEEPKKSLWENDELKALNKHKDTRT